MKQNQSPPETQRPSLWIMLLDATGLLVFSTVGIGVAGTVYINSYRYSLPEQLLLSAIALAGIVGGLWYLIRLKRANRRFLDASRIHILNHPEDILIQWSLDGHDYMIARQGLLVDGQYHGFNEFYENLMAISWEKEDVLCMTFSVYAGKYRISKNIELPVPAARKRDVMEALQALRQETQ